MFALPVAHARAFIDANYRYHDKATPDAERNQIVTDLLAMFREEDANISVWDMLALFDAASGDEPTKPPAAYFITVPRRNNRRRRA